MKELVGSYVPLGQHGDKGWSKVDLTLMKKAWKFDVVSFEVWRAATCYDHNTEDGGPAFQGLMHWALTDSGKPHNPTQADEKYVTGTDRKDKGGYWLNLLDKQPTKHWDAETRKHIGAHWKLGSDAERYSGGINAVKRGEGKKGGPPAGLRIPYTDVNYGQSRVRGSTTGTFSNNTGGGGMRSNTGESKEVYGSLTSKPVSTEWLKHFMTTAGIPDSMPDCNKTIQGATGKAATGNIDAQFHGTALFSGEAQKPEEGCPTLALRLAAYYGLYYYKGCREGKHNWSKFQEVEGTTYEIKMRAPNPAYKVGGEQLPVDDEKYELTVAAEELNPMYTKQPEKLEPSMTAGLLADLKQAKRLKKKVFMAPFAPPPVDVGLTWDYLARKGEDGAIKSELNGFVFPRNEYPRTDQKLYWDQSAKSRHVYHKAARTWLDERFKEAAPKDCPNWGDRFFFDEERAFGWTPPSALFLYPHSHDESALSEETRDATIPGYQPWPEFATTAADMKELKHGLVSLAQYFAEPPKDGMERQKAALRMDYDAKQWAHQTRPVQLNRDEPPLQTADVVSRGTTDNAMPGPQAATAENPATGEVEGDFAAFQGDGDDEDAAAAANVINARETGRSSLQADTFEAGVDDGISIQQSWLEMQDVADGDSASQMMEVPSDRELAKVRQVQDEEPLKAGTPVREGDGNHHFFSLDHSPWAPSDVYETPTHKYKFSEMDEGERKEYETKYGDLANTLLRHTTPHKIDRIEQAFGEVKMIGKKSILEMRLDSYTSDESLTEGERAVFRKNMRRILSIYHDASGDLGRHETNMQISVKEKGYGMRNGIWGNEEPDGASPTIFYHTKGRKPDARHYVRLLPPVFKAGPFNTKKVKELVTNDGNLVTGDPSLHANQPNTEEMDGFIDRIESEMTVLEWLQTPWHYEYLPYQPVTSVFKDGETYCAGCTRCSRPYFEYEYSYAAYVRSTKRTRHWPHSYWREHGDYRFAPLPFHDPLFWSDPVPASNLRVVQEDELDERLVADLGDDLEAETDRGFHNWVTRSFLLGYKKVPKRGKDLPIQKVGENDKQGPKNPLMWEWNRRANWQVRQTPKNDPSVKQLWGKLTVWSFREYINHAYDPDKDYENYNLIQGALRSKRSSVVYGMKNYRLMRSIKYGNVCRDCAFTLDMAPRLYIRAGVTRADRNTLMTAKGRPANQADTWWVGLQDRVLKDEEGADVMVGNKPVRFDPWFIYLNTSQDRKFQQTSDMKEDLNRAGRGKSRAALGMEAPKPYVGPKGGQLTFWGQVKKHWEGHELGAQKMFDLHMLDVGRYAHEKNCKLQDGEQALTKVVSVTVNTQKTWSATKDKLLGVKGKARQKTRSGMNAEAWAKGDSEKIIKAREVLEKFKKWLGEVWAGKHTGDFQLTAEEVGEYNRALYDALHDTHYEMSRQDAYRLDDKTTIKKFDSNMKREEWRNWDEDGYPNSLRVKTLVDPTCVDAPETYKHEHKDGTFNAAPERCYHVVVYPCKRMGKFGEKSKLGWEHEWRGDGWVTAMQRDGQWEVRDDRKAYQIRKLTQSRLFVTYSLHQRIQSEMEARSVMEKMADAVRLLFGNDEWLCEIISFGLRVSKGTDTDSIAVKELKPIEKPRKAATVFYGGPGGNSYVYDTYQTHVESVDVDVGVEIGPTYHMPHFHALVTINHWSYVQIDTMRMRALLEQMFKGTGRFSGVETYKLISSTGLPFYTDNENPYVDIRVYPSDNWDEVIRAYVRKTTQPGILEAQRTRTGS